MANSTAFRLCNKRMRVHQVFEPSFLAIRQMSSLLCDIFNMLCSYFVPEHKRLVLWNMPLEIRSSYRVVSSAISAFVVFESVIRAALCKYWNKVHFQIGRGHNPSSHLLMGSWLTPLLITLILLYTQAEKVILQYLRIFSMRLMRLTIHSLLHPAKWKITVRQPHRTHNRLWPLSINIH